MIIEAMLAVATAGTSGVTLSVALPKSSIIVGEPLKLVATWTVKSAVSVDPAAARILINDGAGYHDYAEASVGTPFGIGGVQLRPDLNFVTAYVMAATGQVRADGTRAFAFPFPTAGNYRVKLTYGESESNEASVSVAAPQGRDAIVFASYMQGRPDLLTEWGVLEDADFEVLDGLLQQYSGSAYTFRPQLLVWQKKIERAVVAYGASGGSLSTGSPLSAEMGSVLAEIESADWTGVPFDEDRLVLIADTRLKWGDRAGAIGVYDNILTKYPQGAAAQYARAILDRENADVTAPLLSVSASPSSLWPPNHQLVSITVAVTVSDDMDAHPQVKLVSITCDDSCNPAHDIAEAALNTDDRAFQLTAWRTGSGSGRTYTITYSATDASENSTTATTSVTVPHDWGD